jgi:RNA polymerase sigma factor (sigma-70 family)
VSFLKHISSSDPDNELVVRYRESCDLALLGELYGRYMDLVYGVCLKYLQEPEDAKDAVLNIFEELVTKLRRHEVENFKSWLYGLSKNHCLMRLRSEKRKGGVKIDPSLVQSEESVHLNGELDKEESFKQLEFCLGQLIADQRQVIELFYLQGKCYNQIVEQTGMEWSKVRSYIQNGRRNLKICMDKQQLKSTV